MSSLFLWCSDQVRSWCWNRKNVHNKNRRASSQYEYAVFTTIFQYTYAVISNISHYKDETVLWPSHLYSGNSIHERQFYIEMGPDLWAWKPQWISIKIQYSLQWKGHHAADELGSQGLHTHDIDLVLQHKITNWSSDNELIRARDNVSKIVCFWYDCTLPYYAKFVATQLSVLKSPWPPYYEWHSLWALHNITSWWAPGGVCFNYEYHQTSNISHTKSQNLNVSHLVLKLSLPNPLKPGVKNEDVVGAAPAGVSFRFEYRLPVPEHRN